MKFAHSKISIHDSKKSLPVDYKRKLVKKCLFGFSVITLKIFMTGVRTLGNFL
jgi:hypothetical protein